MLTAVEITAKRSLDFCKSINVWQRAYLLVIAIVEVIVSGRHSKARLVNLSIMEQVKYFYFVYVIQQRAFQKAYPKWRTVNPDTGHSCED